MSRLSNLSMRRTWGAALFLALVGAVFVSVPLLGARRSGDTPEQTLEKLREVLKRERPRRVLVRALPDAVQAADDAAAGELERAEDRLAGLCRDLSIENEQVELPDHLALSHMRLPEPEDLRELMKDNGAGASLIAIRRQSRAGAAYRIVLLNDQKVLWSGRIAITREYESFLAPAGRRTSRKSRQRGAGGNAPLSRWQGIPASYAALLANGATAIGQEQSHGALTQLAAGGNSVSTADLPDFNAEILEFAEEHLGQQVGNGQCWTLAAAALDAAGAKPPDVYDFGTEVALAELVPGDILYFYDARFVSGGSWFHMGAPHHVAVVGEVQGSAVAIFHQNVNGALSVRRDAIDLSSLQSGRVTGYRAEAPGAN